MVNIYKQIYEVKLSLTTGNAVITQYEILNISSTGSIKGWTQQKKESINLQR